MSVGTHITKRKGSDKFYARIVVPMDLRTRVGKTEIWKSLKTSDRQEANRVATGFFAEWLGKFAALRGAHQPTEDDLRQAAFDHYQSELDHDARQRAALPTRAMYERTKAEITEEIRVGKTSLNDLGRLVDLMLLDRPLDHDRQIREFRRKAIVQDLASGETHGVRWAADAIIEREKLDIRRGSPTYLALCQRLQRAELEVLKRASERDGGDWSGELSDPAVKPSKGAPKRAKPGETIMDLFAIFKAERLADKSADTWDMNEKIVRVFIEFVGTKSHVSAITRSAIRDWKVALNDWPVKAAEITEFKGLTFREVIRKNRSLPQSKTRISDRTKNKYLSAMGSFCTWLLVNEHIPNDVMKGMSVSEDKRQRRRIPYRDDQLTAIFGSPIFVGCQREGREHIAGDLQLRDWRYWLPYIAMYSGARLGELCQLETLDVRKMGETWVLHITEEGPTENDKRVKTEGSQRVVPLHPKLIALGFLDFHAEAVAARQTRLFPELQRDSRGHFGAPSRFFGRYFKRIGAKVDSSQTFHSFRHGIADAFRRAGFRDEEFAPLLGHVRSTTTARYGLLREGELSTLKRMIDAVEYPGLR